MRAGGGVAALRPEPGRNNPLINFYQQDKRKAQYAEKRFHFYSFIIKQSLSSTFPVLSYTSLYTGNSLPV